MKFSQSFESIFWDKIDKSKIDTNNIEEQYQKLKLMLSESNALTIFDFEIVLQEKIKSIIKSKTIAYLEKIFFFSDEFLIGFAGWVILKGEKFYKAFLRNPDNVAKEILNENEGLFDSIRVTIRTLTSDAYMLKNNIPEEKAYDDYIMPCDAVSCFIQIPYFPKYTLLTDEEYVKLYPKTVKMLNERK